MRNIARILVVLLLVAALDGCRRSPQAPADGSGDGVAAAVQEEAGGRRARRQAEKRMSEVANKVEFKGLERFGMHGLSGVDIELRVANNTNMKLSVEKLEFTFRIDGRTLASGSLSRPVELEKRSESVVLLPFRIRIDNPLAVLSAVSVFRNDPSRITVSGSGRVKAGGLVGKNIEIKDVPLDDLMEKMGLSKEAVLEKINL